MRVYEYRVMRKTFGPRREEQETGENCVERSLGFVHFTIYILLG